MVDTNYQDMVYTFFKEEISHFRCCRERAMTAMLRQVHPEPRPEPVEGEVEGLGEGLVEGLRATGDARAEEKGIDTQLP